MKELLKYLENIAEYDYLSKILEWEMDTIVPCKSREYLINIKTDIEMKSFKLKTSEDYKRLLDNILNSSKLIHLKKEEQIYIKKLKTDYDRFKKVPTSFYEEYCTLISNSTIHWTKAKEKNDYNIFKPFLEEVIAKTKEYYAYMYREDNLYDAMLDTYEEGLTRDIIDKLFKELKREVIPLVKNLKVKKLPKIDNVYNETELINIGKYLLDYIGFDNKKGALGIYPHGYTITLNKDDVRITFAHKNNIIDHICTIIHEGGHGIFEQNVSPDLRKYLTYDIDKYALHESQSRFYENILGRNLNFWKPIYEEIKDMLKLDIPLEKFGEYLNHAQPSLIRTEADELTYTLHIIMRYEIERDLFDNIITVEDLPRIWQEKVKEYFGLDVESANEGILQDVHWAQGNFGYFPSYLIGSIFDGMLIEVIENNLGSIDKLLRQGKIKKITQFLNENIHIYGGTYNILDTAKRVCQKEMTVEPLVNYFKKKYGDNNANN